MGVRGQSMTRPSLRRVPIRTLALVGLILAAAITGVIVGGASASPPGGDDTNRMTDSDRIQANVTIFHAPGETNRGRVRVEFDLSALESDDDFAIQRPFRWDSEQVGAGFSPTQSRFVWDGETDHAELVIGRNLDTITDGEFEGTVFAYGTHSGVSWTLMPLPANFRVIRHGVLGVSLLNDSAPGISVTSEKPGFVGEHVAYIGPYDEFQRSVTGEQTIRLIVPAAARREFTGRSVRPERYVDDRARAVLDSIATAARTLRVGGRDSEVQVFAAPHPARHGGLAYDSDAIVAASSRFVDPNNIWIHEYVHTRQAFGFGSQRLALSRQMRWFVEASAEYYATISTYLHQDIQQRTVENHLRVQDEYGDDVLSSQWMWDDYQTPYEKGGAVAYALDHRIRRATDGQRGLIDVFRKMNAREAAISSRGFESFTIADFKDVVATVSGERMDGWIDRYVTTEALPTAPAGSQSFLADSGAMYNVSVVNVTDRDGDGKVSGFDLRVEADTTIPDDLAGNGDPYFEVRVDDSQLVKTDEVEWDFTYHEVFEMTMPLRAQDTEGRILAVTATLWEGDTGSDDLIDRQAVHVNYERPEDDRVEDGKETTTREEITQTTVVETTATTIETTMETTQRARETTAKTTDWTTAIPTTSTETTILTETATRGTTPLEETTTAETAVTTHDLNGEETTTIREETPDPTTETTPATTTEITEEPTTNQTTTEEATISPETTMAEETVSGTVFDGETTEAEGIPGYGVLVALIAIAAAILIGRREP